MLHPVMFALMTLTAAPPEDAVALPPPPPPPVIAPVAYAAQEELPPVRSVRRLSLAANSGWNSMSGIGVELGYNLTPHFSLDLGAGYSLINGWRGSVRPRFNLLESRWTPFIGLAADFNPQSGGFTQALGAFAGPSATTHPSIFLTPTVGMTFQGYNGFFFLAGLGYAVQVAGQRPTGSAELINRANSPVGNGIAADLAIGFAF